MARSGLRLRARPPRRSRQSIPGRRPRRVAPASAPATRRHRHAAHHCPRRPPPQGPGWRAGAHAGCGAGCDRGGPARLRWLRPSRQVHLRHRNRLPESRLLAPTRRAPVPQAPSLPSVLLPAPRALQAAPRHPLHPRPWPRLRACAGRASQPRRPPRLARPRRLRFPLPPDRRRRVWRRARGAGVPAWPRPRARRRAGRAGHRLQRTNRK